MRFKAHALPPPPRSTRTRGAAAAATPPTPQKTRQPQNRKEPEPRPSLVMRPTPSVVVEDRTRHTTYTRDLGNGLTLGGSWAAKEARLLELEEAKAQLEVRCALAEARAEAPSAQNERLRMRSQLRAAQENARMATEDALAAHFMKNVSRHEARIANACSDQCTKRLAETAARLAHSEHEVVELLKAKTALETKCHRLEKLWETERKGRDVLDHARAQKEKHVCVLLKERDRLEREVKALRRKGETPTPRKMAAPVTPTDVPSPVKMRPLVVATPSPQKDALELLEGEATPAKTTPRPARALDLQAAALRKYQSRDVERKKELAKLQAQLKRAEAKNKELQVRYGNRPDQRRPRTAVY